MFQIDGQLTGGAPIVRKFQVSETCYVGQLVETGIIGGLGGHVQVLDAASEAVENDQPIVGVVLSVEDESRTYDSTYRGDKCTYTTTQATIKANGSPGVVTVGYVLPGITLVKGPLNITTYGVAPQVLVETSGDSGGTTITHAGETVADAADDYSTIYCRTGANRGLYRVVTTGGTGAQVVTIPFPNAIAIGDTFVRASCVLGVGGLDIITTANAIEADAALTNYFNVFYHDINLEEAGKEYAVFTIHPKTWGGIAV